MTATPTNTPLRYIDHDSQDYATSVPRREGEAEFSVGEFLADDGGTVPLGEFSIALHAFERVEQLAPKLNVFGDATGALQEFIRLGGLVALSDVGSRQDFNERLRGLGIVDISDHPLSLPENPLSLPGEKP